MRSEREMFELIINTAEDDERIRAVILNGSRANPNAPKDIFQDFDVIFVVTDLAPFKNNDEWIKRFGEIMIKQLPEEMGDSPPEEDGCFVYLMQFTDGNRIDLTIYPLANLSEIGRDSLSVILLDKDGIIEPFPPPLENDYLPMPPTAKAFDDCCNEFWWVSAYVAKGLWREEITYARSMLDQVLREELMKMLNWYIGVKTGFSQNPGKHGKYFQQYLEPKLWQMLLQTYMDADYENNWQALLTMCRLFRQVALFVEAFYGFEYPHDDDSMVFAHLEHVRNLPKDASSIY